MYVYVYIQIARAMENSNIERERERVIIQKNSIFPFARNSILRLSRRNEAGKLNLKIYRKQDTPVKKQQFHQLRCPSWARERGRVDSSTRRSTNSSKKRGNNSNNFDPRQRKKKKPSSRNCSIRHVAAGATAKKFHLCRGRVNHF